MEQEGLKARVGRRGYGEMTTNTNALLKSLMETYYYGSFLKYTHIHIQNEFKWRYL